MRYYRFFAVACLLLLMVSGCSLFKKKSFEESDQYRELMKNQKEFEKKTDSVVNYRLTKELDSLKRASDSLEKEINKSMENLKKTDSVFNKKLKTNK